MGQGVLYVRSLNNTSLRVLTHLFCRADYVDDEYIQELLTWTDPELVDGAECVFTENENMTMLKLPRKECKISGSDCILTL
jgi:hypothetical protein